MPIQLKDLTQGVRSVRVDYADDSCQVQYKPGANTAAAAIEMQERMEDDDASATEVVVDNMLRSVVGWDLVDGDKALPVSKEILMQLPIKFLYAILAAIAEDQNPPTRRSRR